MPAVPKRKVSTGRRDRRRAHYLRLKVPNYVPCPQCHNLRLPHHVCPKCGSYRGVEVYEVKSKKKKKSE